MGFRCCRVQLVGWICPFCEPRQNPFQTEKITHENVGVEKNCDVFPFWGVFAINRRIDTFGNISIFLYEPVSRTVKSQIHYLVGQKPLTKNNEYFPHLESAVWNVCFRGFFWQESFSRWGCGNRLLWKDCLRACLTITSAAVGCRFRCLRHRQNGSST